MGNPDHKEKHHGFFSSLVHNIESSNVTIQPGVSAETRKEEKGKYGVGDREGHVKV